MFRALKYANFRLFFIGQSISLTGNWMHLLAQPWLVYRLSHSPFVLGLVGFAAQIPILFLGPFTGAAVDRLSRHRLLLWTQALAMIQALLLAGLTLKGVVEVWHVLLLALGLGVVHSWDFPARQVFIAEMVDRESRSNAIALNSMMVNITRSIGPAAAGILVSWRGEGSCFLINGLSFTVILACLWAMKGLRERPQSKVGSSWDQMKEGVRFATNHRPIRAVLFLVGIVSMAGLPYAVLLPVFADTQLHVGSHGLGWLMAASGIGATLGTLYLAGRKSIEGLDRLVFRTTIFFSIALFCFAFSKQFWLSLILNGLIGCWSMLQIAGGNTLLQEMVEDKYRGQVMSFYGMMFLGLTPLGCLISGSLAAAIGVSWTVALGAAICLCAGLVLQGRTPLLSQIQTPPLSEPSSV